MRGETVTVYRREASGFDALGEPRYAWSAEEVDNVLVRPVSDASSNIADADRPDEIRIRYVLAFPKTYQGASLAHCRIALSDRDMPFDDALEVSGSPDYLRPCPTAWNMLVYVGRTDG